MSRTGKQVAISLAILAAAGGAAWWLLPGRSTPPSVPASLSFEDQVAAAKEANAAGLSSEAAQAARERADAPFARIYAHTAYGFSFGYPDSLKIGSAENGTGGITITAQDAAAHVGFQVHITPWSGGPVTAEAVARDLPQIAMRDPQQVTIGGVSALAFLASDPNFGDSRQVWFSHQGSLYQISTYTAQDVLLEKVLGTWQFK